jgi:hypothetical protein
MATYDQLINDRQFLTNLYNVYEELDYDIPATNQEMVDDFLSRSRNFENNILGTFALSSDIDKLSDEGKSRFGEVYQQVEELPTIFEEGSAPVGRAIVDNAMYAITDPTNILGIIGGIFTGGAATAGTLAAKEAAKRSATGFLKNRLKATVSAPVLKAAGVDAAISGVGGAAREAKIQETEMDVGIRDDYDPGTIALTGLLEGPGSVALGGALGTGVKAGAIGTGNLTRLARDKSEGFDRFLQPADNLTERMRTLLFPNGGLSEDAVRISEIAEARQNDLLRRAADIEKGFNRNAAYQKIQAENDMDTLNLINRAAEGRANELKTVRDKYGDELANLLEDGRKIIRESQNYANEVEGLRPGIKSLFDSTAEGFNPTYLRRTYDAFELGKRRPVSFDKFIKQNPDAVLDLYKTIQKDAYAPDNVKVGYARDFGFDDAAFRTLDPDDAVMSQLRRRARDLYEGRVGKYDYGGSILKKRQKLEPTVERFLGKEQAKVGTRIFRSVEGIVEPITQIHRANEIGRVLEADNLAVYAKNAGEAQTKFRDKTGQLLDADDLVPISSSKVLPMKRGMRSEDFSFYVPKTLGDRINKVVANPAARFSAEEGPLRMINNMLEATSFLQGAIKLGKTGYNPVGHIRNIGGMGMSVFGSGNYKGAMKYLQKKDLKGIIQERTGLSLGRDAAGEQTAAKRLEKEQFRQLMTDLGISDTGVTFRQIMNRLGPEFERGTMNANTVRKVAEKVLKAGKVGDAARRAYQATDEVGKFMAFAGERQKMEDIWKASDDAYKDVLRDQVRQKFTRQVRDGDGNIIGERTVGMTDDAVLDELAARKALNVMPTYSRVPVFTEYFRGVPVIGNFMAFQAEVFRNAYNIMKMGHQEMVDGFNVGNNALVRSGAQRLATLSSLNAGLVGGAYAWNELNGYDEIASSLKDYLSFDKYNPIVITGVEEDEDGKRTITYRDLGYINPFNPISQIANRVMAAAASGKPVEDALAETLPGAIGDVVSPFVDQSLASEAGQSLYRSIMATTEGDSRTAEYYLGKTYRILEPGFAKMARELVTEADVLDPNLERVVSPRYFGSEGKKIDSIEDVGEYFYRTGLVTLAPERRFEVDSTTGFALSNQSRDLNTGWSSYRRGIGQLLRDPSYTDRLDYERIAREYEEELGRQVGIQANIADLFDDLEVLAGSKSAARKVMRDPDLKSAMPRSRRERGRLLRDRSAVKRLSTNNEFWKEIRRNNPELNTGELRSLFRKIERAYDNKNLNMADPDDLPEVIFE